MITLQYDIMIGTRRSVCMCSRMAGAAMTSDAAYSAEMNLRRGVIGGRGRLRF